MKQSECCDKCEANANGLGRCVYPMCPCHISTVTPPETINYMRTTGDGHCYKCHEDCNVLVHGCSAEDITPCTQNCGKWFKLSTPDTVRGWRGRFRHEFVVQSNAGTGLLRYTDADKIENFIATALQGERARLAKVLETMYTVDKVGDNGVPYVAERHERYCEALDDVRTLLQDDKIQ
jgi:hypothetical protein